MTESEAELARVEEALKAYPLLPDDVWIGKNSPADKVTWLIRRLEMAERTLQKRQEAARE